jgi:hypothetical protein
VTAEPRVDARKQLEFLEDVWRVLVTALALLRQGWLAKRRRLDSCRSGERCQVSGWCPGGAIQAAGNATKLQRAGGLAAKGVGTAAKVVVGATTAAGAATVPIFFLTGLTE